MESDTSSISVDCLLPYLPDSNFRLLAYGSMTESSALGRDADLLAVVRVCDRPICQHFKPFAAGGIACNLYVVSESTICEDIQTLSFGGYYAHKVALSFAPMADRGEILDPAVAFWTAEFARASFHLGRPPGPARLMRWVHGRILSCRPDFLRSLAKFVRSPSRIGFLESWLSRICEGDQSALPWGLTSEASFDANMQRAFFLFWTEYERHKGDGQGWSFATVSKMRLSLDPEDLGCVREYLGAEF